MASNKEYLDYVLDLLRDVKDISYRTMMGEYVLYCQGKVFGGIYDNRFLIKETPSVLCKLESIRYEIPYPTAKRMVLVDMEDHELLADIIENMVEEIPSR